MPELPEVEVVRRGLARARLQGPIGSVWRSRRRLRIGSAWTRAGENLDALVGARPGSVRRRGKFLIFELAGPGRTKADRALVIHLGMSGRCEVVSESAPVARHTHLRVSAADGRELRFVDPRRFGGLHLDTLAGLRKFAPLAELGVEPLSAGFSGEALASRAGRSSRTLRDVLLDQRMVAGIGNIYASEALFEARLHPLACARSLPAAAWERLAVAIVVVLRGGIAHGGTTLRDYRDADGRRGRNQDRLWVYGRAGAPCRRCGAILVGYVHGTRSGVFCPREQAHFVSQRTAQNAQTQISNTRAPVGRNR
jgi:formamidopyrimidine-DNA glycosylase